MDYNTKKNFALIAFCAYNSSLEGAMKLKYLRHSVPLDMPFHMVSFLAEVKFRFWPKTMDYNKAF